MPAQRLYRFFRSRAWALVLAVVAAVAAEPPQRPRRDAWSTGGVGPGADYLAEAVVRSSATGRPLAGHGRDDA